MSKIFITVEIGINEDCKEYYEQKKTDLRIETGKNA